MPDAGFVWICDYEDSEEATRAGATLLASGMVADIERSDSVVGLSVMADDVDRACEVLGLAAPSDTVARRADDDEPIERYKWTIPRDRIPVLALIYGVAVLVVTVGVFLVAVVVFGGDFGGRVDPPSNPSEIYNP